MRVAVLGTGSIGVRHLEAVRQAGAEAIAVPVRPSRLDELKQAGYLTAPSLQAAMTAGAEGAIVATDTARHAMDTQSAIDLGLHVLCEKPLAPTASAAEGLLSLAEARGVELFVGYCLRFQRGLQAFRSRLTAVGSLHSVRIECRSYLPDWRPTREYRDSYSARRHDGGVLLDLSHEIDYAQWLFGTAALVRGVIANLGRLGIASEEVAEGFWSTHERLCVAVNLDYLTRVPVRFVRASGSDGELTYDFITGCLRLRRPGHEDAVESFETRSGVMYVDQIRAFLAAADGGQTEPLADAADALRTLAVCDAWRRSSDSGTSEVVTL